jgi:hypothetical protein
VVGGVVLFVEDGFLAMLEVHWDDSPIPQPRSTMWSGRSDL